MNLGRKVKKKVSFKDFFFSRFRLLREGFFFACTNAENGDLFYWLSCFFTGFLGDVCAEKNGSS